MIFVAAFGFVNRPPRNFPRIRSANLTGGAEAILAARDAKPAAAAALYAFLMRSWCCRQRPSSIMVMIVHVMPRYSTPNFFPDAES